MRDAVVLLAGGAAKRLPGKLERVVDGKPLMLHAFDNLRGGGWPMYVVTAAAFSPAFVSALDATVLYDAHPLSGPLVALLDASDSIEADRIFAIAADQPRIDAGALRRLAACWQPGDEAVVPRHAGGIEPLAALYERNALRRGGRSLPANRRAMRDLLATLRVRYETMDARYFENVNTPQDLLHASAPA